MNVRTGRQRSEVCKAKENRRLLRGLRLWVSMWLVGATTLLIPITAFAQVEDSSYTQNDQAKFEAHVLLGCVIVHEIGHLLLGAEGHSADGIMQPHLGPKQVRQAITGTLMFTSHQSKLLRAAARRRMWLDPVTL
jgi:hypothetical protein